MPNATLRDTTRQLSEVNLPTINQDLADQIEDYIVTHYDSRRPPIKAARLLALICQLDWINEPYPHRTAVSRAVGCSVFTLDDAINVALMRNMITIEHQLAPSTAPRNRVETIVRRMFYRPGPALQQLAKPFRRIGETVAA